MKILAQAESAPGTVGVETHAQIRGHEFAVVALQLVALRAVDDVHAEMVAPVISPFRFEIAFDDENKFLDVLRHAREPGVIFRLVVVFIGREEFDDRTERTFRAENEPMILAFRVLEPPAVIVLNQFSDLVKILFEIRHEHRPGENRIGDGFGNFRFAAAGNRAGFVAKRAFGHGADEPPGAVLPGFFHAHLVTRRAHIGFAGQQLDGAFSLAARPGNFLPVQIEQRVFGHIDDVRIFLVHSIALRLQVHQITIQRGSFRERMPQSFDVEITAEFLAQIETGKHQRAARVFLLAQSEKIGGIADLGFDLFLAVTVVVVGNDGDNHTGFVAASQLERLGVVVKFPLVLPAHAVAALAFRGLVPRRQAGVLLGDFCQMRRENDAAGVAGPMVRVQARVIFRQTGIARVAENAFHEIEIADQIARGEEADFHRFFGRKPRHFRADNRAQQQRDKTFRRLTLCGGERQPHNIARRRERERQHFSEHSFRHGQFVFGNGQAAFRYMKNSLSGAPVAARIVQHALFHLVRTEDAGRKLIAIHRQRKHARHAGAIQG